MTKQPPIILIITIFIHDEIFYERTTSRIIQGVIGIFTIRNEVPYEKTILPISPEINLRTIREFP